MGIDLRYPNITGATEREQIQQLTSYLFQFVDQLQYVIGNFDTTVSNGYASTTGKKTSEEASYDPQILFSDIKALIIKSADIVNAYYEKLKYRFEGAYVAQSDFGTFKEQTLQDIETNSTGIEQAFNNVQEIRLGIGSNLETLSEEVGQLDSSLQGIKEGVDGNLQAISDDVDQLGADLKDAKNTLGTDIQAIKDDVAELNFSIVEVSANINSGLLYYDADGVPVYGLEIGQKNVLDGEEVFNKFARFTAGRLSFYDQNGYEVAYISDYKLYITHAEVTGTLKLGGFLVDTSKGLTIKWVGRG